MLGLVPGDSVSRVLFQVVVGRPRLRLPLGFQSCDLCWVPAYGMPNLPPFPSSGIGLCCVLLQSSSLEMVSGHLIRRICGRVHTTWSFESSALVCFHVSNRITNHSKTDFTLELKMVSLVLRRMFLLFQTGFRVK